MSVGDSSNIGCEPPVRRDGPPRLDASDVDRPLQDRYEHVILGAGCAGLSLCWYLLERGVEEPILLLDSKEGFADDRTWCFWDVEDTPFSHLAVHRWRSWSVSDREHDVVQTSSRYPYLLIPGASFYQHALQRILSHENVTLRLGESVEGYEEFADETRVKTAERDYAARYVFDGRGLPPGSPEFEKARKEAVCVPQKFLGWRLRTRKDAFDPGVCTLMDFSVDQARGLRFVYTLPVSVREALVENVYLSEVSVGLEEHRKENQIYLRQRCGLAEADYTVDGEEMGYIPMTDYRFPRRLGERTFSIGMLGGETRPSTGYTFLRIQRYCRALARSVTDNGGLPEETSPWRYGPLDSVFLRFMRDHPESCPEVYRRMFAGVPPDSLVRFLTEKSNPADELRLVGAMPKASFLGTAGRALLE